MEYLKILAGFIVLITLAIYAVVKEIENLYKKFKSHREYEEDAVKTEREEALNEFYSIWKSADLETLRKYCITIVKDNEEDFYNELKKIKEEPVVEPGIVLLLMQDGIIIKRELVGPVQEKQPSYLERFEEFTEA